MQVTQGSPAECLLQIPWQRSKHSRGSGELQNIAIMLLGARKLAKVAECISDMSILICISDMSICR